MIVVHPELGQVAHAKFYMSRSRDASVVRCNLWTFETAGHGSAGGWGYHKTSAALMEAIRDAGITLSGDEYGGPGPGDGSGSIAGRGHGSMESAMRAIARATTGKRRFFVISI